MPYFSLVPPFLHVPTASHLDPRSFPKSSRIIFSPRYSSRHPILLIWLFFSPFPIPHCNPTVSTHPLPVSNPQIQQTGFGLDPRPAAEPRPSPILMHTWAMQIHFSMRCALCEAARPGAASTEPSTQPVTALNWATVARTVGEMPEAPGRSR